MATDNWNGNGDWNGTPADWSLGKPPAATDDAEIQTGTDTLTTTGTADTVEIDSGAVLSLTGGAVLTTGGTVTVENGGRLKVDTYGGSGGSKVTIDGNLINGNYNSFGDGGVSVGSGSITTADSLTVDGTFTNTGGTLNVTGGNTAGATATFAIAGAAPTTLTGNYVITGNTGGAVVRWGSGAITEIGDGASNAADLQIDGANAFVEIGATNSNSALSTLTTIASNGLLDLRDGAQVTTAKGVTISGGGRLKVDTYGGSGGSKVTIGGNLVNGTYDSFGDGGVSVGSGSITTADSLTVDGTFTNTGGTLNVTGGNTAGATATFAIAGAAPTTLTGNYVITGNTGGAVVRWGSGAITEIGDGASNAADLQIDGANAFVEIGATNSNSALSTLTTIASNGLLDLRDGAQVTTAKGVTISGGGRLKVDTYGGSGGSKVTIGGNLVNGTYDSFGDGGVSVGSGNITTADSLTVDGTFTNTGGLLNVTGGQKAGATATFAVTGAAPATLTGNYYIVGNAGGAVVRWGSGGITEIGDGASNAADLYIDGANAFAEIGATNSNSALSTLTTIANNGELDLRDGVKVTTAKGVTISGGGRLKVDTYGGSGGSKVTIGGNLVNGTYDSFGDGGVSVGSGNITTADSLTVDGTFTNTGGLLNVTGGQKAGATATFAVTGAAPATLTGNYYIVGNAGGAVVRWGSGGITEIGDGASNAADLYIDGANAFAEIGATNSNSALSTLTTIANNGELDLRDGVKVTTAKGVTISGGGRLKVDTYGGSGGSKVTIGGNLVNGTYDSFGDGGVSVGSGNITTADSLTVDGTFTNTGGLLNVTGGQKAGATATFAVTGAAPATLTGNYYIVGNAGGAVVRWGSGGITEIGDGASNAADLYIDGANAFAEIGATNSNSALSTLTTIASNGELDLRDGVKVTTAKGVTISGGGRLKVDTYGGSGGSKVTIGGNLVNGTYDYFGDGGVSVGSGNITTADSLTVDGTFTNIGGTVDVTGGNTAGATATFAVTGAAPATLTGNYYIVGNAGGAVVRWGSGGITKIGDGASNAADLQIEGADAVAEVGSTGTDNAVAGLTTIANNGELDLRDGTVVSLPKLASDAGLLNFENGENVTIGDSLNLQTSGRLKVDTYDNASGGSTVTIDGNLVNGTYDYFGDGGVSVGNGNITTADSLTVKGTLANTGGTVDVTGGNKAGATATFAVTGAAPATLTGNYYIVGNAGGAVVRWGSGGITKIGDGASNAADLQIEGADAVAEVGSTGTDNAVAGLTTIANNGELDLRDGTVVSLPKLASDAGLLNFENGENVTIGDSLNLQTSGRLKVDTYDNASGGSTVTIDGNLVNGTYDYFGDGGVSVGNGNITTADSLTVKGTLANTGGTVDVTGGNKAGATATFAVTGAAPATLTGNYYIVGNAGGAVVRWGSGGITKIGDGASNAADLQIEGADAVAEVGSTGTDNAVAGLTTIANNGELDLRDGTVVSLPKLASDAGLLNFENGENVTIGDSLNLQTSGRLKVDTYDNASGGSTVTIDGNLVNGTYDYFGDGGVSVGNGNITTASKLTVTGTLVNPGVVNIGGDATASATMTVAGGVTNTGTVDIAADGSLAVTGGKSYVQTAGLTTVDGNLSAANIDVTGGVLDPAGTISGNLTLGASSTYDVAITGAGAGQIQALNLTGGAVALQGGTLELDFNNGFTPAAGESFTLATFAPGSLTGTFGAIDSGASIGSINEINIAGGLTLEISYDNAGGDIRAAVVNSPVADAWKGTTGVWSNANEWGSGEPTAGSDVTIGTTNGDVQLDVNATVADLTIKTGDTLQLNGATALDVTGGVAATGKLLVDPGASLEIGGAASGTITFNGVGGSVRFDAPSDVTASIANFTSGNTVTLTNTSAVSAAVSGNKLTVGLSGGGSLTYTLTGTTDAAGYSIVKVGSDTEITGKSEIVLTAPKTETAVATMATSIQPLSITDPEAGSGTMTVTLTAKAGTLAAKTAGKATVTGSGSKTLTLKGTLADINSELASVTYDGTAAGSDTIAIAVTDPLGATTSADVAITTQAPPNLTQPVLNIPSQVTLIDGQPTGLGQISITDPSAEASGATLTLELKNTAGVEKFSVDGPPGATITGQNTSDLTVTGTVDQINADFADGGLGLADILGIIQAAEGLIAIVAAVYYGTKTLAAAKPPPVNIPPQITAAAEEAEELLIQIPTESEIRTFGIGDGVHIAAPGGFVYNFDAAGEFVLAQSTVPGNAFEVQIRLQPLNGSSVGSAVTEVAAGLASDRVTISIGRADPVWIDGVATAMTVGQTISLAAGQLTQLSSNVYQIAWNTGEILRVTDNGTYLDFGVGLAAGDGPGTVSGLMGPDKGNADVFSLPNGTVLAQPLSSSELYGTFANAWRVTQATSRFDYGPGQSTATFTNTNFPGAALTLADFPAAIVSQAEQAVAAAGITNPVAAQTAELDYITTGENPSVLGSDAAILGAGSFTAAGVTPSGSPPPLLGVDALHSSVVTPSTGPTDVTFEAYLTQPATSAITVDYAVIASGSDSLTAAAFGGTLPSGSVVIKKGATSTDITIAVPQGALASDTAASLSVQISTPDDVAIVSGTAQETVVQPEAGPPPVPQFEYLGNVGNFTGGGGNYTLDLGAVQLGEPPLNLQFGIINTAAAGADEIAATGTGAGDSNFSVANVLGFTVSGDALPAALGAGQSYQGITVAANEDKFGDNSETITFNPVDTNASEFTKALAPITLTITDTLELPSMIYSEAWGDVHIITYNGLAYNFQQVGEFVLAESRLKGDDFEIQMRLEPWYAGASVTVIRQVAIQLGSDSVTFDWTRSDTVWVDGGASTISQAQPTLDLSGGTITEVSPSVFKVTWKTGETMTVSNYGGATGFDDIIDGIPGTSVPGSYGGLQGEDEGTSNDFQLADGTVLPQPVATSTLYGEYSNSWRVSQATSLFNYPAGETTANFTDKNFPGDNITLADLPAAEVAAAAKLVAAAGITDPGIAQEAELDYLATGDLGFITSAETIQQNVVTTTTPTVTNTTPATAIGVSAVAQTVTEAKSGVTPVTFTAYLTSAEKTNTTVDYSVLAAGSGFLAPAAVGASATGSVTIDAGATSTSITIDLPQGVLGTNPSENLEVQVSDAAGIPVFAPTAQTEIDNNQPVPGNPAIPVLGELNGGGTFTFDAKTDTYTLNLGSLAQATAAPGVQIALVNAAMAPADSLSGAFTAPLGSGFLVTGNYLSTPIAAGASYEGLYYTVQTDTLGAHTMTLSFDPTDVNDSGYSKTLAPITLVVEDTITTPALAALDTPSTVIFPNVRVGTAESQHVSVSNTAKAPAESLDVTPSANGQATASGSISLLAPGGTDINAISVGLDTGAAGARSGAVNLDAESDGGQGNTSPILPSPTVDVFGSVYRVATGSVTPLNLFVHVGAPGTAALSVANTDPTDGYSESLIAQLTKTTGGIAIASTGPSPDIAAGTTDPGPLQISFSTAKAGTITGTATVALTSDGGTGADSIDGLGKLALAPQTVDVTITVQGYAEAAIEKASGAGTLTQSGTSYTLNLGSVKEGGTALSVDLGVSNIAPAPSDSLSGSFKTSGASEYTLSGFTAGVANIAAGGAQTGLDVTLDTVTAGVFTETITLTPTSVNANNSTTLPVETLTITGTVLGQPVITVPGPLLVQQGQSSSVKGVSVAEPGAPASEAFTVVVADTNGVLSATTAVAGGGGTITSGTGGNSLTIVGTLAQVNADLTSLGIQDSIDSGDTITVNASDAAGDHAPQKTIAVAVNAPPVVTAPATAIVQPNQASPVPDVTVADPDAVSAGETITATVSDNVGLLSASAAGPGGGGVITGAGTTQLTVTGTLAQVNADLAGLTDAVNALVGLQPEPGSPMPVDQLVVSASDSRGGNATPQTVTVDLSSQTSEEIDGPSSQMAIFSAFGLGTLKLDDSQGYTGQMFGFAAGDVIDLADIGFGAKSTLGFAENGAGTAGTLTVGDGTHAAALTLLANYMASSFVTASDGHGGTLVGYTDPPELQNLAIANLHG